MVKDKLKFDSQSVRRDSGESANKNIACEFFMPTGERRDSDQSVNNNIAYELLIPTDVRGCSENTPVVNNSNTNTNNSSFQQTNSPIPLTVYHQDIRGLRGKVNELLSQLIPTLPQVLCFSEHHMNQVELQHTSVDSCYLGASYCQTSHVKGGVSIFMREGLRCTSY
jgi:hypothetical protein